VASKAQTVETDRNSCSWNGIFTIAGKGQFNGICRITGISWFGEGLRSPNASSCMYKCFFVFLFFYFNRMMKKKKMMMRFYNDDAYGQWSWSHCRSIPSWNSTTFLRLTNLMHWNLAELQQHHVPALRFNTRYKFTTHLGESCRSF